MKTHRALVIGVALTIGIAAQAQDVSEVVKVGPSHSRENVRKIPDFQRIIVNYLACLNSENAGVVESALGHVTLARIKYPEQDLKKIQEKLYDLASQGATQSIRHKAFTAMQVFANPLAFKESIVTRQANGDGLLEVLAAELKP
jgi:hypothetical protein